MRGSIETMRFRIEAFADPQALMRILGYFAQRSLVPQKVDSLKIGDRLRIDIEVEGMERGIAALIAAKLEGSVLIAKISFETLAGDSAGKGGTQAA